MHRYRKTCIHASKHIPMHTYASKHMNTHTYASKTYEYTHIREENICIHTHTRGKHMHTHTYARKTYAYTHIREENICIHTHTRGKHMHTHTYARKTYAYTHIRKSLHIQSMINRISNKCHNKNQKEREGIETKEEKEKRGR